MDADNIPLVLPNDLNDLDNEINNIAGMDYIPEDAEKDNEHFVPQDPDNKPAEEYETEHNEVDDLAGLPAEAPFQDLVVPINDYKSIEAFKE